MRTIGIKQFQNNIYKQAQDLPVTVTRDGKAFFVVVSPNNKVATIEREEVATKNKEKGSSKSKSIFFE